MPLFSLKNKRMKKKKQRMSYLKCISTHSQSLMAFFFFRSSSFKVNKKQFLNESEMTASCKNAIVMKRTNYIPICWIIHIWIRPATAIGYVHGLRCRSETISQSANQPMNKKVQKEKKNQANESHSPRFNSLR